MVLRCCGVALREVLYCWLDIALLCYGWCCIAGLSFHSCVKGGLGVVVTLRWCVDSVVGVFG